MESASGSITAGPVALDADSQAGAVGRDRDELDGALGRHRRELSGLPWSRLRKVEPPEVPAL